MGLEKYESKQQQIFKPAASIYPFISRFDMLTPALKDKVEEWSATEDTCSFKVKGFTLKLRIAERAENRHVKITGDGEDGLPVDFAFWIQLHQVSDNDTRMRLVLHANLNMVLRMMIGGKIQGGLDRRRAGYGFQSDALTYNHLLQGFCSPRHKVALRKKTFTLI